MGCTVSRRGGGGMVSASSSPINCVVQERIGRKEVANPWIRDYLASAHPSCFELWAHELGDEVLGPQAETVNSADPTC